MIGNPMCRNQVQWNGQENCNFRYFPGSKHIHPLDGPIPLSWDMLGPGGYIKLFVGGRIYRNVVF